MWRYTDGMPTTAKLTVRVPHPILAQLREVAADYDRSLNWLVLHAVMDWLQPGSAAAAPRSKDQLELPLDTPETPAEATQTA